MLSGADFARPCQLPKHLPEALFFELVVALQALLLTQQSA